MTTGRGRRLAAACMVYGKRGIDIKGTWGLRLRSFARDHSGLITNAAKHFKTRASQAHGVYTSLTARPMHTRMPGCITYRWSRYICLQFAQLLIMVPVICSKSSGHTYKQA